MFAGRGSDFGCHIFWVATGLSMASREVLKFKCGKKDPEGRVGDLCNNLDKPYFT